MECKVIQSYCNGAFFLDELVAYSCDDISMLINPKYGTTLMLDTDIVDLLAKHNISEDVAFMLVQRGMAKYLNSRAVIVPLHSINPTFFLIDLTNECNLSCKYCFRSIDETKKRMSLEMLDRICDTLIDYAQKHPEIQLFIQAWGGEPILQLPLIIHLRHRFRDIGLNPEILIETNATLITKEIARELVVNDIRIGISIDGIAKVHDFQRCTSMGKPTLSLVEQGIHNLHNVGCYDFGTITVVTKYTYQYLTEILEYFTTHLHLKSIKFNLMRKNEHNKELALDVEDIEGYLDKLLDELLNLFKKRIPILEQNISQRMANLLFRPNNNICNSCGCHGGYIMLSIDSNGQIYPCELSDYANYSIGKIGEAGFEELISKAIENNHEYFLERDEFDCQNCPWMYYCKGGCKAAKKYLTGSPYGIDYTECKFNRLLYPKLIKILLTKPEFGTFLLNGVV